VIMQDLIGQEYGVRTLVRVHRLGRINNTLYWSL
jgi:hypothetical protein